MNRLRTTHADTPALGNANLNARGDIIGEKGIVLKSQEQIEAEWKAAKAAREASVRPVDIKADNLVPDAPVAAKAPPAKQIQVDDQDFEPAVAPETAKAPSRRKITETGE
jgi:hypothetical protein